MEDSLQEHFAGNCIAVCDGPNPNMNDALRATCDTGSQQYCTTGTNIFTPSCKAYLTRVTGNMAADKAGLTYTNPIKFITTAGKTTPTAMDYYNALQKPIISLPPTDQKIILSQDTKDIVNILKANNPNYATDTAYNNLIQMAIGYCAFAPTTDSDFCSESSANPSWAALEYANNIKRTIASITSKNITGSLLAYYSKQAATSAPTPNQGVSDFAMAKMVHSRLPNTVKPIDDMILASLTQADLLDPNLVLLRTVSPYLQAGVDTFVINLINMSDGSKSSFTRERLAATPSTYSVTLNNTPALYGTNVRAFFANLQSYNTANKVDNDPMLTLIQMTDNANVTTCSTGNPLTNPICQQVATATGATNATSILNATVAYCSNANSINDPNCITHINRNQTVYNLNDINSKMLNYCMSTTGQNDTHCKPFSAINGSPQWLAAATKNTTDANGVTTTACGVAGGLSKDTCQAVCTTYPDLCATDVQQKCAAPANRYSTNIDFFEGKESMTSEELNNIPLYVVLLIIFALFLSIYYRSRSSYATKLYQNWKRRTQDTSDALVGID